MGERLFLWQPAMVTCHVCLLCVILFGKIKISSSSIPGSWYSSDVFGRRSLRLRCRLFFSTAHNSIVSRSGPEWYNNYRLGGHGSKSDANCHLILKVVFLSCIWGKLCLLDTSTELAKKLELFTSCNWHNYNSFSTAPLSTELSSLTLNIDFDLTDWQTSRTEYAARFWANMDI